MTALHAVGETPMTSCLHELSTTFTRMAAVPLATTACDVLPSNIAAAAKVGTAMLALPFIVPDGSIKNGKPMDWIGDLEEEE